jgi:hypothetical protein
VINTRLTSNFGPADLTASGPCCHASPIVVLITEIVDPRGYPIRCRRRRARPNVVIVRFRDLIGGHNPILWVSAPILSTGLNRECDRTPAGSTRRYVT